MAGKIIEIHDPVSKDSIELTDKENKQYQGILNIALDLEEKHKNTWLLCRSISLAASSIRSGSSDRGTQFLEAGIHEGCYVHRGRIHLGQWQVKLQ